MKGVVLILFLLPLHVFTQQLVLPGDHPDPSVVKIGDSYWATATTSNWMPAFPLLKSKDLVNWKVVGNVFDQLPEWADYYFWAPEITYDNGKVYIYYAAHKKSGNLCVGVASADKPEGPYSDHGTLICQEVGSIDAFPMRDENGKLYLIWKEDGNSVRKPTPIWAIEMNEERTALIGEKKELFRNDAPWEGNLVEGVSMVKKNGYYYAFYAAAGCCGTECTYTSGVARSKNLLGPWEKYSRNPVLTSDSSWKCPGHGTPVEKDGRNYFLYHAYDQKSDIFTGRQGLLIEYRFTPDGWIEFVKKKQVAANIPRKEEDDFGGRKLSNAWQWSVFQQPQFELKGGEIKLAAIPIYGAYIGRKIMVGNYVASATLRIDKSNAGAGFGAIGDDKNRATINYRDGKLQLITMKDGASLVVAEKRITAGKKLYFRVHAKDGHHYRFQYSLNGKQYSDLNDTPVNGTYLPPWDRAVRLGIIAQGDPGTYAVFDDISIQYLK